MTTSGSIGQTVSRAGAGRSVSVASCGMVEKSCRRVLLVDDFIAGRIETP